MYFMKKIYLLFIALSWLLLYGCSASHHTFHNKKKWMPPDFDPKTSILLIERSGYKRQQKNVEEFMKAKYPYRYAFLGDTIHWDKQLYRFEILSVYAVVGNTRPVNATDYYFHDRLKNIKYPPTNRASSNGSMTLIAMLHTIIEQSKE